MKIMESAIRDVVNMSWPTLVIVIAIILILKVTYYFKGERKTFCLHEELMDLLFLLYLIMLFQLVTTQDLAGGGTNLSPFKEIFRYEVGSNLFYRQVVGNIALFVPLGYFASRYCKINDFLTIFFVTLLSSGVIETVQYFIGRCFDIDDIILNVAGGFIGYLIFIICDTLESHLPAFFSTDLFKNILTIILCVIIFLIYTNYSLWGILR